MNLKKRINIIPSKLIQRIKVINPKTGKIATFSVLLIIGLLLLISFNKLPQQVNTNPIYVFTSYSLP